MNELQENLDDLGASAPVRQLAAAIADRATVSSHRAAEFVGLRPAMDEKAVAPYLHREYASIAVPHSRTSAELARFPGSHPRRVDGPTTSLIVPDHVLSQHFNAAVALAAEMMEWRAAGRKTHLGAHAQHPDKALKICPSCHMQLLPAGVCADCG